MVQITIKDITRGAETIDIDGEQGDELQRIFQKDFGKSLESTQGLQYVTFKKKEILLYGGRELSQDFKDIVLPIFHEKLEMRARREREEKARASARAGGGGGGGSGGGGEGGESAAGEVLFPDGESFVRYMKERVREEVDESVLLELDRRYTKEKLFKDLLESVINRIQRHPNSGITPDILMAIKEISYEGLEGNLGMIKDFVDQANRHASRRASETRRVPAGGGGGGGSGGGGEEPIHPVIFDPRPEFREMLANLERAAREHDDFLCEISEQADRFGFERRDGGKVFDKTTGEQVHINADYKREISGYVDRIRTEGRESAAIGVGARGRFTGPIISGLKLDEAGGPEYMIIGARNDQDVNFGTFMELESRPYDGESGQFYPANKFTTPSGLVLAQTPILAEGGKAKEGYFAAIFDHGFTGIVNMVESSGGDNVLDLGKEVVFKDVRGNDVRVVCTNVAGFVEDTIPDGEAEYTISSSTRDYVFHFVDAEGREQTREVKYVGFRNFPDSQACLEKEAARKAKSDLLMQTVEYLKETGGLSGGVMTNCQSGQNRAAVANIAMMLDHALNSKLDELLRESESKEEKLRIIEKFEASLDRVINPRSGYNEMDLIVDSARAFLNAHTAGESRQRDMVHTLAQEIKAQVIRERKRQVERGVDLAVAAEAAPARRSSSARVPAGGGGGGGSGGGGEGGDLESEMVRIKIVNYSNTKINSIKIPLKILDQFREEHGVDLQDKDCNLVEVMLKGGKGRVKETHFFFDGKEIENRAIRDALYEAVKQEESIKPRVYPFSSDPALKDDVALKKAIKKQSERSRHRFECTWNSITIFEACLNVIDLFDKEKISENLKKRLEKRRGQTLHIRLYDSDGEFYIDGEIPVFKNAESKNIFKNMLYLEAINYPGRDFRSSMIDPEYLDRVNRIKAELAAEASRGRGEDAAAEAAPARRSSAPRVPAGGGGGGGSGGGGEDVSSALEWDAESLFKAIDERLVTKVNDSVELGVPREMAFEDARNSLIKDVFYEDQRRFGDVPYDIAEAILDVKESNVKDLKTRIRARAHGRSMWAVGANVGGDHRAAAAPGRDGGRGRG